MHPGTSAAIEIDVFAFETAQPTPSLLPSTTCPTAGGLWLAAASPQQRRCPSIIRPAPIAMSARSAVCAILCFSVTCDDTRVRAYVCVVALGQAWVR